jgi:MYXO-CTERM domain-containing protein
MRRFVRLASLFAALAVATSAGADTRPPTDLAETAVRDPALLRPCTTPGCAGATSTPWNRAAGFGAAAFAAIWLARRRHAPTG